MWDLLWLNWFRSHAHFWLWCTEILCSDWLWPGSLTLLLGPFVLLSPTLWPSFIFLLPRSLCTYCLLMGRLISLHFAWWCLIHPLALISSLTFLTLVQTPYIIYRISQHCIILLGGTFYLQFYILYHLINVFLFD